MIASVCRLVEAVHVHCDVPIDAGPHQLPSVEEIAKRFGCRLEQRPLPDGVQEIGLPGYFGQPRIAVNSKIPPGLRMLARRHGLAHLVAGELGEEDGGGVRFMSSIFDEMSLEERRADVYALGSLIPDYDLEYEIEFGRERSLLSYMFMQARGFAPAWSRKRLEDRVRLRMGLFYDRRG